MSSIRYEKDTVEKMIRIYCRRKHNTRKGELCDECEATNQYAQQRLDKCPYGDEKGACANCKIHCYKSEMREKVRVIMRYSGPRMIFYYPIDFVIHIFKDRH